VAKKVAKGKGGGKKREPTEAKKWWREFVLSVSHAMPEETPISDRVHKVAAAIAHELSRPGFMASGPAWSALCALEGAATDGVGGDYADGVRLSLTPLVFALQKLEGAADACELAAIVEGNSVRDETANTLNHASEALRTLIRGAAMLANVTDNTAFTAGSAVLSRVVSEGRALQPTERLAPKDQEAFVRLSVASDHINAARARLFGNDAEAREFANRALHIALGLDKMPRDPADIDRIHFLQLAYAIARVDPAILEATIDLHCVAALPTGHPVWGPRVTRDHLRLLARAWRPYSDPNKPQKHETALAIMREVGLAHSSHTADWLREFEKRHRASITKAV